VEYQDIETKLVLHVMKISLFSSVIAVLIFRFKAKQASSLEEWTEVEDT
jgi:hypothetical protein